VFKRIEYSWKFNAIIISYKLLVHVKLHPKIDQCAGMSQSFNQQIRINAHSLTYFVRFNAFPLILVIVAFKNVALLA